MAIFIVGLFDLNTTYRLTPFWIFATTLLGGAIVTLSMVFPTRFGRMYSQPNLIYVPYGIGVVVGLAALALFLLPAAPIHVLLGIQAAVLTLMICAGVSCLLWARQRARAGSPLTRDQASLVLVGFVFALMPGVIWMVNIITRAFTGQELIPFNTSASAPFFVLPTFSMAYAAMQTRSIDADQWISKGITYAFLIIGLILGYYLLILSVSILAGHTVAANDPLLVALVIFVVAAAFVPVRTRLQTQIDKIYFRQRINYQEQVEQFARSLSALRELPAISAEYRTTLEHALAPTHTFIYLLMPQSGDYAAYGKVKPDTDIRFAADSPLLSYLRRQESPIYLDGRTPWADDLVAERARLLVLKPLAIVGFRGSSRLSGFAIIGSPRSGKGAYSYEEQRFIENLTNQMTVAVERAQVVDSLERRVRELGILSRVSQAVNFTGDYDQLLELIGTQTLNLVECSHVYIALRDAAMNELYYAFFLEAGERYADQENHRWQIGSDLVSEVVRTSQPVRVAHYGRAMTERGTPVQREDSALHAWMGVPLIAGSRVLGVLAVGTHEPNRPFTGDQLRMLGDIGALAATSLDKARLFAETNLRARQLASLNDISRKLTATELNLDHLLPLITESATGILNAEAGSLMLAVEDGSGDLEIKITHGGAMAPVGTRISAGRGFVGECVRSNAVVMVNDVGLDSRWAGELAHDGLRKRSILAAPLITQSRTIGVLEIVNRREGTFTKEDADLLSAFAGQAAIAIENARRFQMTDQQLTERLNELELFARIDAEMNRSHSLEAVAEIALRSAVANTGATAGVLGVVTADPPKLRIVAHIGYGELDAPPGAVGNLWPLDKGIVSVVMQTRKPHLEPQLKLNPHYVPSLRGAVSQATVPMLSGGDVMALMVLESTDEGALRLFHLDFLERLGDHASIAIANAQLYEELALANQSKSEFVSFVAHELKNPLTSIKGYADVLVTGAVGGLSDMQRNFIGTIRTNAERMNTLVSDLNDVTKLQTNNLRIEPEALSFAAIVDETLRPLQKLLDDKGQKIRVDVADDLPAIFADRNRMIQVLTNLMSNAHKYSRHDGEITVRARVMKPGRDARGQTGRPMLHVSVIDHGIGMAEEDLKRLFTPYFRSDDPAAREQPGTGLGLTITRGIIERHQGSIWVESALGVGTTFHYTLPLAPDPGSAA
jgi:signal transduction histidine kinase